MRPSGCAADQAIGGVVVCGRDGRRLVGERRLDRSMSSAGDDKKAEGGCWETGVRHGQGAEAGDGVESSLRLVQDDVSEDGEDEDRSLKWKMRSAEFCTWDGRGAAHIVYLQERRGRWLFKSWKERVDYGGTPRRCSNQGDELKKTCEPHEKILLLRWCMGASPGSEPRGPARQINGHNSRWGMEGSPNFRSSYGTMLVRVLVLEDTTEELKAVYQIQVQNAWKLQTLTRSEEVNARNQTSELTSLAPNGAFFRIASPAKRSLSSPASSHRSRTPSTQTATAPQLQQALSYAGVYETHYASTSAIILAGYQQQTPIQTLYLYIPGSGFSTTHVTLEANRTLLLTLSDKPQLKKTRVLDPVGV
ncbi:hypothetical protein M409DRAFT_57363 [Zasmidium cellare ATCC 36951]|uniref:Uncharacterized protein n=1 Tax=Zasmidium cellare ATCC 36951 TaxID=1080233 RepID=A0A6A6C8E4_ZASCE|nr:uncharacterized protein M409DRAFT_57363 [Zasmidium cellare ATCC 36951]KAF2163457.1 hypothetical protein M409DRAFT_57363 [Zasmidium cellare ATCC 36951]